MQEKLEKDCISNKLVQALVWRGFLYTTANLPTGSDLFAFVLNFLKLLKFVFSKKATKIDQIFTVFLTTLTT